MSDTNPLPYRSATPVSARVDAAWERGYTVGRDDGLKHLGLGVIIATWTALRNGRFPAVLAALVVLVMAAAIIPTCALFLAGRRLVNHYRAREPRTPAQLVERVQLDDGTWF